MSDTKIMTDKTLTLSPEQLLIIENSLRVVMETLPEGLSKEAAKIAKAQYQGNKVYDLLAIPDVLEVVANSTNLPKEALLQYRFQVLAGNQVKQAKQRNKKSSLGGKKGAVTRLNQSDALKAAKEFLSRESEAADRTEKASLKKQCASKHHATVKALEYQVRKLRGKLSVLP